MKYFLSVLTTLFISFSCFGQNFLGSILCRDVLICCDMVLNNVGIDKFEAQTGFGIRVLENSMGDGLDVQIQRYGGAGYTDTENMEWTEMSSGFDMADTDDQRKPAQLEQKGDFLLVKMIGSNDLKIKINLATSDWDAYNFAGGHLYTVDGTNPTMAWTKAREFGRGIMRAFGIENEKKDQSIEKRLGNDKYKDYISFDPNHSRCRVAPKHDYSQYLTD